MKVLSIGTDEKAFEAGSEVRKRLHAYAEAVGEFDQVVLSKQAHEITHDGPLTLYPAFGRSPFSRLAAALRVGKTLARPDVVSSQDPFEVGFVGMLLARRFRAPLHAQAHTDFLAPEFKHHSVLNRIRLLLAPLVIARASGIRVVSEKIKSSIESNYHPKAQIIVAPVFIDIARFRHAQAAPDLAAKFDIFKTKLLVVARLEAEKNVELAIRAFAKIASQDMCLIVVGDGSERERLETLAHSLRVGGRVFFEGRQDPAPYYALANLVLVPSTYEGYGLVIIEALAAGKPVLATDVGVARESGAIISSEKDFAADLGMLLAAGPKSGELTNYPYPDFNAYIQAYRDDIETCVKNKLRRVNAAV